MAATANRSAVRHCPGRLADVLTWINPRFGPIRAITGLKSGFPEPAWWIYSVELSRQLGCYHADYPIFATGASIDGDEALRRALGESVERYCNYHSSACVPTRLLDWGQNPLAERFPRCADYEAAPEMFKGAWHGAKVTHTSLRYLKDGAECWVPGGYVHLDFKTPAGEPLIVQPISSGSAFHLDLVSAAFAGLCETAERDAIMSFWWQKSPLREIDLDASTVPESIVVRLNRLRQAGLEARFFDMSTDFRVPAVFCLLVGRDYPFCTTGGSCRSDPAAAVTKSLDEAVVIRYTLVNQKQKFSNPDFHTFDWIKGLDDHAKLYAAWQDCPAFDFLLKNGTTISFEEFERQSWLALPRTWNDLEELASDLERLGLTVLWTETTVPEVDGLGHCVKVVVPEMVPLSVSHTARYLGTSRLSHQGSTASAEMDWNPYPHPFA